jgi:hypothetical protein
MIGIFALMAAIFLFGVTMGVVAAVSLGIRREERRSSLAAGTTDGLSLGARQLTGTHVLMPGSSREYGDYV